VERLITRRIIDNASQAARIISQLLTKQQGERP
jgi:hypothetical protein